MTDVPRPLPPDHPLHRRLADEIHARPPVEIPSPGVAACVALWRSDASPPPGVAAPAPPPATAALDGAPIAPDELDPLRRLAKLTGVAMPETTGAHLILELPRMRVKWERHSEFTSYAFIEGLEAAVASGVQDRLPSAFVSLPPAWLAGLPGRTIAAVDVVLLPAKHDTPTLDEVAQMFLAGGLIGARIAGGAARVFTDYRLSSDGRERWLVLDAGMTRGQQARVVQRLIEIAVYRVAALLALPLARELGPTLSTAESRLAAAMSTIAELGKDGRDAELVQREERRLLDELTGLAAVVEGSVAATGYRFAAARAYWDIVKNRIAELREERIDGVATIGEFLSRRLAPAMETVMAAARRQQALSERIARASELLRTRVDLVREEQSQQILAAMNRRGKVSLRLQQTVEGLSVAAITYYAVGLVGYLAKAAKHVWPSLEPDWVTAAAIPILALLIWRAAHHIRRELQLEARPSGR